MRNDRQQRFSFRKYAVGLVSVVVGCLFFGPAVLAQERRGSTVIWFGKKFGGSSSN